MKMNHSIPSWKWKLQWHLNNKFIFLNVFNIEYLKSNQHF